MTARPVLPTQHLPERTDLYLALSIIDDARHAIYGPGKKVANTEAVLFGGEATRLVRLLGEMKHDAAVGQIPVRLAIHQHHDRGGRMATNLLDFTGEAS